jgi:hydroxymethylbilane synthase
MTIIRIGTRKSPLALAQAGMIREQLIAARPGLEIELVHITTSGDNFIDQPLAEIGGKGLFTKEIEDALLDGSIDIAAHSAKDMLTVLPNGLTIGCMPEREDVRDVLIGAASFAELPKGTTFGTASLRRSAQALMQRPDLKIVSIRGNVQTRIDKVTRGEMGATLLALAGLKRLGLHIGTPLPVSDFLPAVGQGALGIECREGDTKILDLLKPLSHRETEIAVACERAFLRAIDGSCRMPIAGYATVENNTIQFEALLTEPDGSNPRRVTMSGNVAEAEAIGAAAGDKLKR